MSIPSRCRAVVFEGPEKPLRLVDLPVSWPKAGEAIVQVELTTIDPNDFEQRDESAPLILGHETVGTILALGDSPPREFSGGELAVGDRVIWSRYVSCGDCFYCRRRLPQECESLKEYGDTTLGDPPRLSGGMAELVHLWPKTAIFKAPKSLPANLATAFAHAGAKAMAAIDVLIPPVNTALVLGDSLEAKLAAAMLKKRGPDVESLASVSNILDAPAGAADQPSEGRNVDAVLDFTGDDRVLSFAIAEVRIGGAISLAHETTSPILAQIETRELVRKHLRVSGVHRYKPEHLGSALEFAAVHGGGEREMVSLLPKPRAFSEVNEALAEARKTMPVRVAFEPDLD